MLKDSSLATQRVQKDVRQLASWKDRLEATGNELNALSKTTEHAFLSVGDRLTDFYGRAHKISKQSSSVAASFSGAEVAAATQGLRDLLDRSNTLLTRAEKDFGQDVRILQDILETMASIRKPIIGFKKIVKNLGILSISTKIESAQLHKDGHDFTTIADDVERLSILISSSFGDILARTNVVSASVEQALLGVLALEAGQKEKARSILDGTHATLTSLMEKNASSTEIANRVSVELETITGSIGEVVSSIQFHDITRQQMEHVKEALDIEAKRLDNRLNTPPHALQDGGISALVLNARAVCALQSAQLADSGEQFAGATQSIIDNLRGIATTIKGVYGHLERLAGVENTTSSSFFARIETEVSSAVSFFGEMGDGIRELSKTVEALTGTVSDMSGFVEDIENIGMDIELIAVNARIKAAHTGSEGAPLGVIAEAIQRLSADAQVQKNAVSDELRKIISTVEHLHSRTNLSSSQQTTETDSVLKELNALLGGLRTINESALSSLASLQDDGRRLAADMESAVGDITVRQEFATKIADGIRSLETIVSESWALLPESDDSKGLDTLKNLEKNYTMHSERNIHESYWKSNGAATGHGAPIIHADRQHEAHFAHNVELF